MQLISLVLTTLLLSFGSSPPVQQVPSVPLMTLSGESVNLQSYAQNGKITVVSFWATWCSPCKRELDAITKVYPEWQKKYNMELIAVSIDGTRALSKVGPMVDEKGWGFEILSDTKQTSLEALEFQTIPQTFVFDMEGNIVYSHNGFKEGDELELEETLADLAH